MGQWRGIDRWVRHGRVCAVTFVCLALANCANGKFGNIDPKYGVAASPRVVEPGQPVPKGGGVYRVGKPYVVAGRVYVPEEDANYSMVGLASWYGDDFHGRYTANGEIFDMNSISAAHPTLPMPSYVRVTNLKNHRSIVVRVNDRGPYAKDRIIDVSVRTAQLLGFYGHGLTRVKVEYVGRAPLAGSDDRKLLATLRDGDLPSSHGAVRVASAGPDTAALLSPQPMSRLAMPVRNIPAPPERPYGADDEPHTAEFTANRRIAQAFPDRTAAGNALETPAADAVAARATAPVSAYVPARYDAPASFMSGRGLY